MHKKGGSCSQQSRLFVFCGLAGGSAFADGHLDHRIALRDRIDHILTGRDFAEHGVAVWLEADLDLLWDRVRHKDTRPLLRTANPKATLEALNAERAPIYALAELKAVARPEYSIEDMTDEVVSVLLGRPDILAVQEAGASS